MSVRDLPSQRYYCLCCCTNKCAKLGLFNIHRSGVKLNFLTSLNLDARKSEQTESIWKQQYYNWRMRVVPRRASSSSGNSPLNNQSEIHIYIQRVRMKAVLHLFKYAFSSHFPSLSSLLNKISHSFYRLNRATMFGNTSLMKAEHTCLSAFLQFRLNR